MKIVGQMLTAGMLVITLLLSACSGANVSSAQNTSSDKTMTNHRATLTQAEYFTRMKSLLAYATNTGTGFPALIEDIAKKYTAKKYLEMAHDYYANNLEQAQKINPPVEVVKLHTAYIDALKAEVDAFARAAADAPYDAPGIEFYQYVFHTTSLGYGFGAETDAQCDLASAAKQAGIQDFPSRQACHVKPIVGQSVGSSEHPVNTITIVHTPACDGRCPNLKYQITSITARAGQPITITFDNKNPLPFLFNLTLYSGDDAVLKPQNIIAYTIAGGTKVHTLVRTLQPGIYTYADNVHPYALRGTLTVVR